MIRRLDAWIGRRLMQPPIIWICQRAGITQMAFNRYGWWIVALHALWFDKGAGWGQVTFDTLFALTRTISAGLNPDAATIDAPWLRMVTLVLLAIAVLFCVAHHRIDANAINVSMALVAEYATTIRTIPPRKLPARKTSARAVTA